MPVTVLFNPINRQVEVQRGENLLEIMRDAGIRVESLCGGKGNCGKCKVILESGDIQKVSKTPDKFLSQAELDQGYYLACMVRVQGDCTFTIPTESRIDSPKILLTAEVDLGELDPSVTRYLLEASPFVDSPLLVSHRRITLKGYRGLQPRVDDDVYSKVQMLGEREPLTATVTRTNKFPEIIDVVPGDLTLSNYGLAIDIGTTTIVGFLANLTTGEILGRASEMNRQITYGEELVTRISFARKPEGLKVLQKSVVETINDVIRKLTSEADVSLDDISDICAGGNTVMNHMFTGLDPAYLELANVKVSRDPIIQKAKDLGLQTNPEAYAYCVPNVSRFLGGDAVGDVLVSKMHRSDEISLMVDLGTNGEVVFGNSDWLFSSSCASGPAFEGEGVRHGMRGAQGGIDHVKIDPDTCKAEYSVIEDTRPKGICGSGLIDLAAEMFKVGIIDFVGKLVPRRSQMIREGKWGLEYLVVPADETAIGQDIVITQADLDYVIDSKAAACGAITVLMHKLKIGIQDVRHLYLAGAFGTYTDLDNAMKLGIFPEFPNVEIHPIGNGSLAGAYSTLMSMEKRKEANEIAEKMVYVDLLVDSEFIEEYSKALYIPGAKEYFPSH
ncbi:Na(+)-translocating NADH-quinone reductase subunit F [subsurface metagenome]